MLDTSCNGYLPNQINENLNLLKNYGVRLQEADLHAKSRGRKSCYNYCVGDRVWIQDIKSKLWNTRGTITEWRPGSDGSSPRSFMVEWDLGGTYLRNARYLCPAPEVSEENESADTRHLRTKHSQCNKNILHIVRVMLAGVQWGPISVCQQIPSEGCSGKFQSFSVYYKRAVQGETQSVACQSLIQSLVKSLCGSHGGFLQMWYLAICPWLARITSVRSHVKFFKHVYQKKTVTQLEDRDSDSSGDKSKITLSLSHLDSDNFLSTEESEEES